MIPLFRSVLAVFFVPLGMLVDEDIFSVGATVPMVALVEDMVALMDVGVSW